MQYEYDKILTQRLRDLISKCYIKRKELNLHEIQDLLSNPLVDPNIRINIIYYCDSFNIPQYTVHFVG